MPKIANLAPLNFGDKPCQRLVSAQIDVLGLMEPADKISLPGDTRRCHFEGARNRDFGSPAQVPWRPVGPSNQRLAPQDAVGARSNHAQTISWPELPQETHLSRNLAKISFFEIFRAESASRADGPSGALNGEKCLLSGFAHIRFSSNSSKPAQN